MCFSRATHRERPESPRGRRWTRRDSKCCMSQTTVDEILTMSVQVRNVGLLTLRGERKWTAATEHGWLEAGGRAGRTTAARLAVFLRTVGKPRPRSVSSDARARGQAGVVCAHRSLGLSQFQRLVRFTEFSLLQFKSSLHLEREEKVWCEKLCGPCRAGQTCPGVRGPVFAARHHQLHLRASVPRACTVTSKFSSSPEQPVRLCWNNTFSAQL